MPDRHAAGCPTGQFQGMRKPPLALKVRPAIHAAGSEAANRTGPRRPRPAQPAHGHRVDDGLGATWKGRDRVAYRGVSVVPRRAPDRGRGRDVDDFPEVPLDHAVKHGFLLA